MNLLLGLQVGLKEIFAHKFRSFLTMLGIILGVASLLAMFALTEGIARGMRETLEARGGVETVQIDTKEPSEDVAQFAFLSSGRSLEDAEALRRGVPLISHVTAESHHNGRLEVGAESVGRRIVGAQPGYSTMQQMTVEKGRDLSDLDIKRAHRVVVLGAGTVDELWPNDIAVNPIGQTVMINDRPFEVVGTFELMMTESQRREEESGKTELREERRERRGMKPRRRRWDAFGWQNNMVLIPLTTMFHEFKSANMQGGVDAGPNYTLSELSFRVRDLRYFEQALTQVHNVLLRTHRGIDDFAFDTREDWFENIEVSVRSTRVSGGLIAAISLLVGGIGITNIMLASITERIREIGVRRAVGATRRDIFVQIVVESAVIGIIGGLLGLLGSIFLTKLLVALTPEGNLPVVTISAVVISFSFAVVIGILSGLYPAWKAARLDPIEALRYG